IATSIGWLCLTPLFFLIPRFVALDCAIPGSTTRLTALQRYGCQLIGLLDPTHFLSWMIGPPVLALAIGPAFCWVCSACAQTKAALCLTVGIRPAVTCAIPRFDGGLQRGEDRWSVIRRGGAASAMPEPMQNSLCPADL